jgi:prolipoprotein diacylglyceryltransferase
VFSWFSFLIGLGATLGLTWIAWRTPKPVVSGKINAGLWFLLGILLGARIGFACSNWGYFYAHWVEIPQIWLGGLSFSGAVLGGWASLPIIARIRKEKLPELAGDLFPLALILAIFAWLACWTAGTAYGFEASNHWWGVTTLDEWGTWSKRFPVQWIGALLGAAFLLLITRLQAYRLRPGQAASLAFFSIVSVMFGLSFFRADPIQVWRGWRYDTWSAMGLSLIAAGLCLAAFWPQIKKSILPNH